MTASIMKMVLLLLLASLIFSGCDRQLINRKSAVDDLRQYNSKKISQSANGVIIYRDLNAPVTKDLNPFVQYGEVNDKIRVIH